MLLLSRLSTSDLLHYLLLPSISPSLSVRTPEGGDPSSGGNQGPAGAMEEPLEMVQSKDTKERMAGVERLHGYLENCRRSLSSAEVTSLVDCCLDLLKDNNFRVSQGALQSLASAAVLAGEHLKLHFNALVPAVVERLGDAKQPVRDAARRLLLTLMEVSSPTIIVERAGSYAWTHKSWRVQEEFVRTVSSAVGLFASTELTLQRVVLPSVLQLMNDSNNNVREAATLCMELVGRLSQEELMGQLPSFLPALFDAFGSQSADVRKTVVFCLVDIYIVLGKEFLPYLGGLSSTQLRLVTIYANRISQARSGTPINGNQG